MRSNSLKRLAVALFMALAACSPRLVGPKKTEINIIPRPVMVKTLGGSFVLDEQTDLVIATPDPEVALIAAKMIRKINAASSFQLINPRRAAAGKKSIELIIDKAAKNLSDEGYQLLVRPGKIELKAPQPAGLFYAMQSLFQLLPVEFEDTTLHRKRWYTPVSKSLIIPDSHGGVNC